MKNTARLMEDDNTPSIPLVPPPLKWMTTLDHLRHPEPGREKSPTLTEPTMLKEVTTPPPTSSSDSNSSSDSSEVEITLNDVDECKNAGSNEGEVHSGDAAEDAEESGENLENVEVNPNELVGGKLGTCFKVRSLMTQANLDTLVSDGCFRATDCRPLGEETTPIPEPNESVVFRDFFTARLRLPVSDKFSPILQAYNLLSPTHPNSIP